MLGDRHQLDVREAHVLHVLDQRLRDAAIAEECAVGAAPPRSQMQLVHGHRRSERVARAARAHPLAVAPLVVERHVREAVRGASSQ